MDGWMDGWMNGQTDGWKDGWMGVTYKNVHINTKMIFIIMKYKLYNYKMLYETKFYYFQMQLVQSLHLLSACLNQRVPWYHEAMLLSTFFLVSILLHLILLSMWRPFLERKWRHLLQKTIRYLWDSIVSTCNNYNPIPSINSNILPFHLLIVTFYHSIC